jgi:hypothetical protein
MSAPERAPSIAMVLTLIGDMVFWIPSGFYLIESIDIEFRPLMLQTLLIPLCTLGVLACAFLMGRMPKLHVVWGSLILLISSVAVAFDGYILTVILWSMLGLIAIGALGLIVVGGILSILLKPDLTLKP